MRTRWPHAAQWSQGAAEYDEDGYIVGAGTSNWPEETYMAPSWRGGAWRDRAHLPRSSVPVQRRPLDRIHAMEHMFFDADMYEDLQPQRRGMYAEAEHPAYGRVPNMYFKQAIVGDALPRVSASASTLQPHPLASTATVRPAAHVKKPGTSNVVEDVYSFESHNPQSSATMFTPNAAHIAQTCLSPTKGRHSVQYLYEMEEADRITGGLKPFRIECDSTGMLIEGEGAASRFLEVLKKICVVFLDISIIKVRDQNLQDYCRVRENIESEFEFIGHPLSDAGFKKSVFRCMKDERFCLHKLFMLRPDRGCPPKEQPEAWERLKRIETHQSSEG